MYIQTSTSLLYYLLFTQLKKTKMDSLKNIYLKLQNLKQYKKIVNLHNMYKLLAILYITATNLNLRY